MTRGINVILGNGIQVVLALGVETWLLETSHAYGVLQPLLLSLAIYLYLSFYVHYNLSMEGIPTIIQRLHLVS